MTAFADARPGVGKVAAVHEIDVSEFLARTGQQGLRLMTTCAACGTDVVARDAGAFKRFGDQLLVCCDAPLCIAEFVE
jgi:hypothetical protein